MIGSYTYVFFSALTLEELEFILRAFQEHWPNGVMVFEGSDSGYALVSRPRLTDVTNLSVYKDPQNTEELVRIFPESHCTSFVVPERNSPAWNMVVDVTSALRRKRAKRT